MSRDDFERGERERRGDNDEVRVNRGSSDDDEHDSSNDDASLWSMASSSAGGEATVSTTIDGVLSLLLLSSSALVSALLNCVDGWTNGVCVSLAKCCFVI